MTALSAFGAVLNIGAVPISVTQMTNLTLDIAGETVDTSAHDQDRWRTFVDTMKSATVSFDLNWDPNEESHGPDPTGLFGLIESGAPFVCTYTSAGSPVPTYDFTAINTSISIANAIDDKLAASIGFQITGAVLLTLV